eukprot:CAMPEP_0178963084 /NCGR_PEP_ID=MMETSP0789-20121207/14792_1 /TAXON_ID=3005 /ORGANISM="Rhizosolenia setigera, Strain CCMP 1694" /LENGTH=207 /DNA_ID=CAMNT_0020647443 /DNA_START=75 /DNA_END=698 /DNA_ORIENTATION=+
MNFSLVYFVISLHLVLLERSSEAFSTKISFSSPRILTNESRSKHLFKDKALESADIGLTNQDNKEDLFTSVTDVEDQALRLRILMENANEVMTKIKDEVSMTNEIIDKIAHQKAKRDSYHEIYEQALKQAKEADLRYGIGSDESCRMWNVVDSMYYKTTMKPQVEMETTALLRDMSQLCDTFEVTCKELEEKERHLSRVIASYQCYQ